MASEGRSADGVRAQFFGRFGGAGWLPAVVVWAAAKLPASRMMTDRVQKTAHGFLSRFRSLGLAEM